MSRIAEFVRSEANHTRSRDNLDVADAALVIIKPADVLGKVTATGKIVKHNPDAVDGSQNAIGIARDYPDKTLKKVVAITRDAEVETALVNLPVGDEAATIAALTALGIIFRS